MMKAKNGIIDLCSVDLPTCNLTKRRRELEKVVAPFVTSTNTGTVIGFRGKKRYLKVTPPGLIHAVLALQHLYGVEAARRTEDTEKMVRNAIGFADADANIRSREMFGADVITLVMERLREKQIRLGTRTGKTKCRKVPDIIFHVSYAKHSGKKNWLRLVRDDVADQSGITASLTSIREELKRRGIKPTST